MPRRRKQPTDHSAPVQRPAYLDPHLVQPTAVYRLEAARRALGLAKNSVQAEVKAGRLRVSKRCGRYFFLGSWLLEWLMSGEMQRHDRGPPGPANDRRN